VNFLVDENMPRSLAAAILASGFAAQDVRDLGLRSRPDAEVMELAITLDAIIITRDRLFADPRSWPEEFTAGIIFVNLDNRTSTPGIITRILDLIQNRQPNSLLGAYTSIDSRRSLCRPVRSRKF
jgi:predicted nuclease of predicted toxin-antitoxin system